MTIRVLRLIEYVYQDALVAADDMAHWTIQREDRKKSMRSTTLPFEAIEWEETPEPPKPVTNLTCRDIHCRPQEGEDGCSATAINQGAFDAEDFVWVQTWDDCPFMRNPE